ncbi:MAG: hypothetical protein IJJ86_06375 [Clostridia bacterium]|nr:hypothetical protein [Clostridia bacterium]
MTVLEHYYSLLDAEALREKEAAETARDRGNERERSIHLMKASMLGDMLKVLGRIQHEGKRPDALTKLIESFSSEADKQRAGGDYDESDRAEQKAITVQFACDALTEAERYGE